MNIKEYYEQYWKNGGYSSKVEGFCRDKRAFIAGIAVSGGKILDIGCGDGEFSAVLGVRGNEVFGIDISETAVEAAKRRDVHAEVGDINAGVPFKDGVFDAVLLFDALEHVFNPVVVVREACRVLRPGGKLYCGVPNAAFLVNRLNFLLSGRFHDFTSLSHEIVPDMLFSEHIRFFSPRILTDVLSRNGFTIEKTEYWFPVYFQKSPLAFMRFVGVLVKKSAVEKLFPSLLATNMFVTAVKRL